MGCSRVGRTEGPSAAQRSLALYLCMALWGSAGPRGPFCFQASQARPDNLVPRIPPAREAFGFVLSRLRQVSRQTFNPPGCQCSRCSAPCQPYLADRMAAIRGGPSGARGTEPDMTDYATGPPSFLVQLPIWFVPGLATAPVATPLRGVSTPGRHPVSSLLSGGPSMSSRARERGRCERPAVP